jgi:hypothetical protein
MKKLTPEQALAAKSFIKSRWPMIVFGLVGVYYLVTGQWMVGGALIVVGFVVGNKLSAQQNAPPLTDAEKKAKQERIWSMFSNKGSGTMTEEKERDSGEADVLVPKEQKDGSVKLEAVKKEGVKTGFGSNIEGMLGKKRETAETSERKAPVTGFGSNIEGMLGKRKSEDARSPSKGFINADRLAMLSGGKKRDETKNSPGSINTDNAIQNMLGKKKKKEE